MALDKRVIAIQMLPKAYDEIQRLKGEQTWTQFIIECVLARDGDNAILKDELAGLVAEIKARKDKPKVEKKAKAEKPAEPKQEPTEPKIEPTKPEVKVTTKGKKSTFGMPGEEPTKAELKQIEAAAIGKTGAK